MLECGYQVVKFFISGWNSLYISGWLNPQHHPTNSPTHTPLRHQKWEFGISRQRSINISFIGPISCKLLVNQMLDYKIQNVHLSALKFYRVNVNENNSSSDQNFDQFWTKVWGLGVRVVNVEIKLVIWPSSFNANCMLTDPWTTIKTITRQTQWML